MNSITNKNFYKNIHLKNSSQVILAQHEMNSITDKNFYENIYLRNSIQVI